jgi:hypothetical protein
MSSKDIKYPNLADYAANPRSPRKKIKHPHSNAYAKPYGAKGWRFYDDDGELAWEGKLSQLSNIYDIADVMGDESAFYLVYAAKEADEGKRNNPRENPYYFGQELKKIRKGKRELEYGEDTDPLGYMTTQPDLYDEEVTGTWSREQTRQNPSRKRSSRPPGVALAIKTFEGFNEYPSKGASKFAREIVIPDRMPSPGPCRWVTYRSDKWNNGTHDYIHTITSYPRVKCAMAGENYDTIKVPAKVRNATTVTQIGLRALGFAFEYDDDEYEAKVPAGTEWFWSQTARALYLIQNKRKLIAVIWGGNLNVEPRGIVG